MKIHKVIQRSKEWHEIRHAKIGGTSAKGLFADSDTLAIELTSKIVEGYNDDDDDGYTNEAMQRGIDLEPQALLAIEQYSGYKFGEFGWLESDECDLLGLSPDGMTTDLKVACEIKCPSAKKHLEYILANEIPSEYVHQIVHYFTVNQDLQKLLFASYRPEFVSKPIFVKEVLRDSEINVGTKAKPKMISINVAAQIALENGKKLQEKINEIINKLNF
jgi:putative phage-type endonuclease